MAQENEAVWVTVYRELTGIDVFVYPDKYSAVMREMEIIRGIRYATDFQGNSLYGIPEHLSDDEVLDDLDKYTEGAERVFVRETFIQPKRERPIPAVEEVSIPTGEDLAYYLRGGSLVNG